MKNRTTHQILADVLEGCAADRYGLRVTPLCQKANVSHGRLLKVVELLTSRGLINEIEYDGHNTFVTTQAGRLYLEEYKNWVAVAESFGMEL